MNNRVNKNDIKIQNKQHDADFGNRFVEWRNYEALGKEGLIRIVSGPVPLNTEMRTLQESHNANHALYYLSLLVHSMIYPIKRDWSSQSKVERITAHLSSLYEFMDEEEHALKMAVKFVMDNLKRQTLDGAERWAKFLYENWKAFEVISDKYSLDHTCFCRDKYQKLEAIVFHRQYVEIWWWQYRFLKLCRRMKKLCARIKERRF